MVSINTFCIRKVMFFLFTSVSTISSCAVAHLHMPFNVLYAHWEKASKAVTWTQNIKWGRNPRKTPVQFSKSKNSAEKQNMYPIVAATISVRTTNTKQGGWVCRGSEGFTAINMEINKCNDSQGEFL